MFKCYFTYGNDIFFLINCSRFKLNNYTLAECTILRIGDENDR
jgi:hypothetical protein